jgi:hypothetical protein
MKKIIILLLTFVMLIWLVGCPTPQWPKNGTDGSNGQNGTNSTTVIVVNSSSSSSTSSNSSSSVNRIIVIRVHDDYIQWQYQGDTTWTNLILLSEIINTQYIIIYGVDIYINFSSDGCHFHGYHDYDCHHDCWVTYSYDNCHWSNPCNFR